MMKPLELVLGDQTFNMSMEGVIANSFMDYHVKGFHYVNLVRDYGLTVKLYFFEGDVAKLPEVVAPHDHRYDFRTTVVRGLVVNKSYARLRPSSVLGMRYQKFTYLTPLNGGDGFTWAGEEQLRYTGGRLFSGGGSYLLGYNKLHTISIRKPGTVLRLDQYVDRVPLGAPTTTYTLDREPPSLSGLYRKPTPDEVLRLLGSL